MKINYKYFFRNSKFTTKIIILFLIINIFYIFKSYAVVFHDGPAFVQRVVDNITQIGKYVKEVQSYSQLLKNTADTAKGLRDLDLKNIAYGFTGNILTEFADISFRTLYENTGGFNPLIGGQIIIDYTSFKKARDNMAGKKTLDALRGYKTLYTNSNLKSIVRNYRDNKNNEKPESVKLFTLPSIAKEEICNSDKLRNTIEKGNKGAMVIISPVDFTNTGFKNIDDLCIADIQQIKTQQVFITLARGGYGDDETRTAFADKNNTPFGQKQLALEDAETQRRKDKESLEELGKAMPSQCANKDGIPKTDFDPTDPNKSICEKYITDPSRSKDSPQSNQDAAKKALIDALRDCLIGAQNIDTNQKISLDSVNKGVGCLETFAKSLKLIFPKNEAEALVSKVSDSLEIMKQEALRSELENKEDIIRRGIDTKVAYKAMINLHQDRLDEYNNLKFDLNKIQKDLAMVHLDTNNFKNLKNLKNSDDKIRFCQKSTRIPFDGNYSCDYENDILTIHSSPGESDSMKMEKGYIDNRIKEIGNRITKVEIELGKATSSLEKFLDLEEKIKDSSIVDKDINRKYTNAIEDGPNEGTVLGTKNIWELKNVAEGQENLDKSEQRELYTIRDRANRYLDAAKTRRDAYADLIQSKGY